MKHQTAMRIGAIGLGLVLLLGLATCVGPVVYLSWETRKKCDQWEAMARDPDWQQHLLNITDLYAEDPEKFDFGAMERTNGRDEGKTAAFAEIGFNWQSLVRPGLGLSQVSVRPVHGVGSKDIVALHFGLGRDFVEVRLKPDGTFSDYSQHYVHHDVTLISDRVASYCTG